MQIKYLLLRLVTLAEDWFLGTKTFHLNIIQIIIFTENQLNTFQNQWTNDLSNITIKYLDIFIL